MEAKKNTHWRKIMNTTFLNGDEIPQGDTIVTISSYKEEMIYSQKDKQKEPQVTMFFNEFKKPLIMTNRKAKQITDALNTPYMDEWIGKKIAMFAANERHFGEDFKVITFKKAVIKKEVFNSKHARWNGAVEALKSGASSIEAIEKHYTLTEAVKTQLNNVIKEAKAEADASKVADAAKAADAPKTTNESKTENK